MPRCPRCGDQVDRLESLPVEALRSDVRERMETDRSAPLGSACHWCRHELLEK